MRDSISWRRDWTSARRDLSVLYRKQMWALITSSGDAIKLHLRGKRGNGGDDQDRESGWFAVVWRARGGQMERSKSEDGKERELEESREGREVRGWEEVGERKGRSRKEFDKLVFHVLDKVEPSKPLPLNDKHC
jgi:hypothetical protein